MESNTGHESGNTDTDSGNKTDASSFDKEAMKVLQEMIRTESNNVFHSGFTKRASGLEKQLDDLTKQIAEMQAPKLKTEQVSETELLSRQLKDLSQKYEGAQKKLENKEINDHIMSHLRTHNVQMPDVAAVVLKDRFKYEGGRVVAMDEYSQETDTDKIIEGLLKEKPGFRPPRNASGTAAIGGGGASANLPSMGNDSDPDALSRDDIVKMAGSEEKARKLGLI